MGLTQLVTIFAIVVTNLGTVIFLHCHLDNRIEKNNMDTKNILQAIQIEMRDFHGRLCAIEERNRK